MPPGPTPLGCQVKVSGPLKCCILQETVPALPFSHSWGWLAIALAIRASSTVLSRQGARPALLSAIALWQRYLSLWLMCPSGKLAGGHHYPPIVPRHKSGKPALPSPRPQGWFSSSFLSRTNVSVLPRQVAGPAFLSAAGGEVQGQIIFSNVAEGSSSHHCRWLGV